MEDWDYETRGGETVRGDIEGEMQITDPEAAHFRDDDRPGAFWRLLDESMEATFADRWLDDILDDPEAVAAALERDLDDRASRIGFDVEDVELSDLRAGEESEPAEAVDDGTTA